jgi:subtilase family serine protease
MKSNFIGDFPKNKLEQDSNLELINVISSFPTINENYYLSNCVVYKHNFKQVLHPNSNNVTPSFSAIYTPIQIRKAYGLDKITISGNRPGEGITVAVVIAYSYPNLQRDFNTYCNQFKLPLQTLKIVKMPGATYNEGWALEECLDVQQVHAMAPYAKIMVIEAKSASITDIFAAIAYANKSGVNIVSMSFGITEFSQQMNYLSYFNNSSICYVASSGDTAARIEFPSSSPNVLSVGGTTLQLDASGNRISEVTWNSGGCGISAYINKPIYQTGISTIPGTKRTCCDLSLVANPDTGVYTYFNNSWYALGGTSLSAPCMAGMLAICNQLRKINRKKTMLTTVATAPNSIMNYIYKDLYLPSLTGNPTKYIANFNDINNGTTGGFTSINGYDYPTGLGSPIMNVLANTFLNIK